MAEQRSLVKKLAQVMTKVQYIQKRGRNTFHNYTYATEADVNDKVRECLAEVNVIMLPSMKSHQMRETTTNKGQTEYIVCVDMEFRFVDGESGEELVINMSGEGQDRGDKAIYKAISGAQKYALMKVFMIPTGDDPEYDGGDNGAGKESQSKPSGRQSTKPASKPNVAAVATKAQVSSINSAIRSLKLTRQEFIGIVNEQFNTEHETVDAALQSLTEKDADKLITVLADYKKEATASA